jgi:acetyl esterase/lipase
MKHAGVDVTLEIWPKVFHVWQVMADILPEGRKAIEKIVTFARQRLGQ